MANECINNTGTTTGGQHNLGAASTSTSYVYTTGYSNDKTCATCNHRCVCKYREKTEEAIRQMPTPKDSVGNIKLKLECDYYSGMYYSYPITYTNNDWWNNKPTINPIEITCCECHEPKGI